MGTVLNWGNPLHKPCPLFLLGFGVITAYVPGIIGASISTGWLFLLITVPILFLYCDFKLGFGFLFICYVILSLAWTEVLNIGWFYLLKLIVLGCVFYIGQNIKDLTPIFKGLVLGLGISSIVAIAQKFGFTGIYTLNNSIAGLFINPNIYSEISAILLVSLVVLKLWWWIPVTLPGLILVHSRAAFVGLGVGLLIWGWKQNKRLAVVLAAFVCMAGVAFYWNKFDMSSLIERWNLWADTAQGFKFFGNGVGSFEILYPKYATHIDTEIARPRFAHNDFLNLFFEFGIGSILFVMVLINVVTRASSKNSIIFTIITISMVTYPIHTPTAAFIAFLVAGNIVGSDDTHRGSRTTKRSTIFKGTSTKRFGKAGSR